MHFTLLFIYKERSSTFTQALTEELKIETKKVPLF